MGISLWSRKIVICVLTWFDWRIAITVTIRTIPIPPLIYHTVKNVSFDLIVWIVSPVLISITARIVLSVMIVSFVTIAKDVKIVLGV